MRLLLILALLLPACVEADFAPPPDACGEAVDPPPLCRDACADPGALECPPSGCTCEGRDGCRVECLPA